MAALTWTGILYNLRPPDDVFLKVICNDEMKHELLRHRGTLSLEAIGERIGFCLDSMIPELLLRIDLLAGMLRLNPDDRLGLREVDGHEWLSNSDGRIQTNGVEGSLALLTAHTSLKL